MSFLSSLNDYMTGPIRRQADQEAMLRQAAIERMRSVQSAQAKLIPGLTDPTTNDKWQPPISVPSNISNFAQTGDVFNPGSFFDPSSQIVQQPGRAQPLMGQQDPQPGGLLGGPEQFKQYQQSLLNQANPDQAMQRMQMAPALENMTPRQRDAFMIDAPKAADAFTKSAFPEMTPEEKLADAVANLPPDDPRRPNLQAFIDKKAYIREKDPLVIAQTKAQTASDIAGAGEKEANAAYAKVRTNLLKDTGVDEDTFSRWYGQQEAGQKLTDIMGAMVRGTQGQALMSSYQKYATARMIAENKNPSALAAAQVNLKAQTAAAQTAAKRGANVDMGAIELDQFANQVLDAAKAVGESSFVPWNKISNMTADQFSDPKMATYWAALQGARSAFATLISRNGGTTVDGQHRADDILNGAKGFGSMDATMAQLKKESHIVQSSSRQVQSNIVNSVGSPGGSPTKSPTPVIATIPNLAAVQHLKQNPELAPAFDEKYGPGSAAKAMQ